MLYLRTGANGSCKTLFTLWDVRDLQLKTGRPVAWNGRFKLNPEKELEFGWTKIDFKDWQSQPDGTIFLIDECHNDMPKRSPGSAVPEPIRMLAEHRARGFDFFLLTQHPMNIDDFVRRLVGAPGWHQHLKRVFGGTKATRVLQWDAVNPQCEKDGSGRSAQITTRSQPKQVFEWYDSAVLHTAKVRVPRAVWVLVGAVVVAAGGAVLAVQALRPKPTAPVASMPASVSSSGKSVTAVTDKRAMTVNEYMASYTPRIAGLMHTAPIYDDLTKPKRVPVPAACIEWKKKGGCKCFTQDATPYPVPDAVCRDFVQRGVFLAFSEPSTAVVHANGLESAQSAVQAQETPSLVIMNGPGFRDPSGVKSSQALR
jgi:zona occludens toxin